MSPTPSPSFETDIVFPAYVTALEGKVIRLIGGASVSDLRFEIAEGGSVYFDDEDKVITDGADPFNAFAIEGDVVTFTSNVAGGPTLLRLYLV